MLAPSFLSRYAERFELYLSGHPVRVQYTGCPISALNATANATELGITLLQHFTPEQIQRHILSMEQEKIEQEIGPRSPGRRCCTTCGMYVHDSQWVVHVQSHAGGAFMASIFPPYDPAHPAMD